MSITKGICIMSITKGIRVMSIILIIVTIIPHQPTKHILFRILLLFTFATLKEPKHIRILHLLLSSPILHSIRLAIRNR